MTKLLHLADNLKLPLEAVTEKLAFLGRTGSGKTYAAQRLAELMHHAGAQFVAIDPVGKWWSLRLAANGKDQGIPLPVFGGLQGDIPLEPSGGALVADVIVDRNLSAVLDVSQFESDADKARCVRDFGARFFFRKKASPSAVHVFLEEAQEFVPQNLMRGEEQMLHIWTRIQKLGRNFGIGTSLLSQRPQEVNKKVLNQTELLFVFQLTGPQERESVANWIEEKGIEEDIAAELPKLKQGSPHAWSPSWLDISKVVTISPKTTWDASSTPKVGAKRTSVKELSPIDLQKLQTAMQATIERAKADDPKLLRKRIAELESQVSKSAKSVQIDQGALERAIAAERRRSQQAMKAFARGLQAAADRLAKGMATITGTGDELATLAKSLQAGDEVIVAGTNSPPPEKLSQPPIVSRKTPPPAKRQAVNDNLTSRGAGDLGKAEKKILIATYWLKDEQTSESKVSFYSGYSADSSTWDRALGTLRKGQVAGLAITEAGIELVESWGAPAKPSGSKLREYLRGRLDKAQNRLLDELLAVYPQKLSAHELSEASGYSLASSTWDRAIGKLRSIEAAVGYDTTGGIQAAEVFSRKEPFE